MVGIDRTVDTMTIFAENSGAQLYLEESMLVVVAAGMAARITQSPEMVSEINPILCKGINNAATTAGISISLSTE